MSVSVGGASEVDGTATAASEVGRTAASEVSGTESGGGADDDDGASLEHRWWSIGDSGARRGGW